MRKRFVNLLGPKSTIGRLCVYCGDTAQCREHFRVWSHQHVAYCLPACNECNAVLGSRLDETLGSRAQWIYDRYLIRHREHLKVRDWEAILDRTEGSLRAYIERERYMSKWVNQRMAWIDFIAQSCQNLNLSDLEPHNRAVAELEGILDAIHRQV